MSLFQYNPDEQAAPWIDPDKHKTSYTAKPGDTLTKIAKKLDTTGEALKKANPQVQNPGRIYAGQTLNLPAETSPQGYTSHHNPGTYGPPLPPDYKTTTSHSSSSGSCPGDGAGVCSGQQETNPWNNPDNMRGMNDDIQNILDNIISEETKFDAEQMQAEREIKLVEYSEILSSSELSKSDRQKVTEFIKQVEQPIASPPTEESSTHVRNCRRKNGDPILRKNIRPPVTAYTLYPSKIRSVYIVCTQTVRK